MTASLTLMYPATKLGSRFLDGLTEADRATVLAAASRRLEGFRDTTPSPLPAFCGAGTGSPAQSWRTADDGSS